MKKVGFNKIEFVIGAALLVLILTLGGIFLENGMLFFRMIIGLGLGYALTRSFFGFAGSVNRSCRAGSTQLMKMLMVMFFCTAAMNVCFMALQDPTQYKLWVNQINLGLALGGILFGFGMALSSCCASGVLTDIVTGLPRAGITLLFFGLGVFLGFPVQGTASWVKDTLISTKTFPKGVFLPDLFKWDGFEGYLGALLLTAVFAVLVIFLADLYEKKRRAKGTYTGVDTEILQERVVKGEEKYDTLFERLFVKPWTLGQGAAVISGLFMLLMGVTKSGWGASTPYGFWFGRLLRLFGVPADSLAAFTHKPVGMFTDPFFENGMNVQNVCIILGTLIALLMMGDFVKTFKAGLKITWKESLIFALGGFTMGFGTRLSNGCNVGALYTPIANLSLSGWIFFVFLVGGGILGNFLHKKALSK